MFISKIISLFYSIFFMNFLFKIWNKKYLKRQSLEHLLFEGT